MNEEPIFREIEGMFDTGDHGLHITLTLSQLDDRVGSLTETQIRNTLDTMAPARHNGIRVTNTPSGYKFTDERITIQ